MSGRLAPAKSILTWLEPIKVRAARFNGLDPVDLAQALLIRYDPGAGMVGIAISPSSSMSPRIVISTGSSAFLI